MNTSLLFALVTVATLSSMQFGLVLSATNTTNNFVSAHFRVCGETSTHVKLNCPNQLFLQNLSTAMVMFGAAVGSFFGGTYADYVGRQGSLLRLNCAGVFVYIFAALSPGWPELMIGRWLSGVVIGAASVSVPMYISDIVPSEVRGSYGVAHQLLITIGIFFSQVLGLAQTQEIDFTLSEVPKEDFTSMDTWWWRFVIGLSVLPAVATIVGFGFCYREYDSPSWLIRNGYRREAAKVLETLGTVPDVAEEIRAIESQQARTEGLKSFWWAAKNEYYRIGVVIGCVLSMFQQLTGINVIITLSNSMFEKIAPMQYTTLLTSLVGLLNVLMTLLAIPIVDHWGRRTLFLASTAGMTTSMAIALAAVLTSFYETAIVTASIFLFIFFFAIGYGPVLWIYLSDIYPSEIKGACISAAIMVNWIASGVIVFGLGSVLSSKALTYSIYTILNFAGFLFVARWVVETKGTDFERSPIYARSNSARCIQAGRTNSPGEREMVQRLNYSGNVA